MNLPNKLSVLRILLVPFIVLFMLPLPDMSTLWHWNHFVRQYGMIIALILFILASVTDCLDGNIARKYQLITNLGKFLDPIADKFLVMSVLIALCQLQRLHTFVVLIIFIRDLAVNGIRMLSAKAGVVVAANWIGKWKTVTQIIAIISIMTELSIKALLPNTFLISVTHILGNVMLIISVILAILSTIRYIHANRSVLIDS